MKRFILVILSVITLVGNSVASERPDSNAPSQMLKAVSANFYNKRVDYNWFGWKKFSGDIEIGSNYIVLPDGKGRFTLDSTPTSAKECASRKYISYRSINQNGEECTISITCFIGGKCIVVVCFDQKSWAYKCSEPITFDFKPSHIDW